MLVFDEAQLSIDVVRDEGNVDGSCVEPGSMIPGLTGFVTVDIVNEGSAASVEFSTTDDSVSIRCVVDSELLDCS